MNKSQGMYMHLKTNFYPPLPDYFINRFIKAWERYWNEGNVEKLQAELSEVGYKGDLNSYDFYTFLNDEDLSE